MLITLCQSIHNSRVWIINQHYAPRGDYLLKVSSRGGKIQRIIIDELSREKKHELHQIDKSVDPKFNAAVWFVQDWLFWNNRLHFPLFLKVAKNADGNPFFTFKMTELCKEKIFRHPLDNRYSEIFKYLSDEFYLWTEPRALSQTCL